MQHGMITMKHLSVFFILLLLIATLGGCSATKTTDIAATTLPVYEFTLRLCHGTELTVSRLVTEPVSCLHDYSLQVNQMRSVSAAQVIVQSGVGLEDFLADALSASQSRRIDASVGVPLLEGDCHHEHAHEHTHMQDSHIWLSPVNAKIMAQNICDGLSAEYPALSHTFENNLQGLLADLDALQTYGEETLKSLGCRQLVTFHDGFAYFAEAYDLEILHAVEEESGSEASAQLLKELITTVRQHNLPAIFTETNGSTVAARVICRETGTKSYQLDMAMAGNSYFDAMYRNINTLKEALG